MKPRITLLTIGVADLERSLAFYRDGLGLPTEGMVGRQFEHGAVAFFRLAGGLKLAIWAQDDIAHDTGLARTPASSTSFTIAHNVLRKEEVDEVMDQAARAGADIVKTRPRHVLRRLCRIFPGSGWTCLGSRLEPGLSARRQPWLEDGRAC